MSRRSIRLRHGARQLHDTRQLGRCWCALLALAVVTLGALVPFGAPPASAGLPGTYSNPLSPVDTPDSDVVRLGSQYYAFSTGDGFFNIPVMTTNDLASWPQTLLLSPDVSEALPCQSGSVVAGSCQISVWASRAPANGAPWAPSMIQVGGRFYLFYAAWDPSVGHYCVGVAEGADPVGPYVDHSTGPVVCQPDLGGSIDPDVYQDSSGAYHLAWKNNDGYGSSSPATLWSSAITFVADGASLTGTTTALSHSEQSVGDHHRTTRNGRDGWPVAPVLFWWCMAEQHVCHRLRRLPGTERSL